MKRSVKIGAGIGAATGAILGAAKGRKTSAKKRAKNALIGAGIGAASGAAGAASHARNAGKPALMRGRGRISGMKMVKATSIRTKLESLVAAILNGAPVNEVISDVLSDSDFLAQLS